MTESATTAHSAHEGEDVFAATLSIHYITMALYALGTLGSAAMALQAAVQGQTNNILAFLLLTLLPITLFIMHMMTVKGLKKRQMWGYKASKALAVLMLLGFPFGTVLGLFMLSQLAKLRLGQ